MSIHTSTAMSPIPVLFLALGIFAGCVNESPSELAVWSEFLPYEQVHEQLDTLSASSCDLYLRVRPADLGEGLWTLLEGADARGVEVRLWLQLPDEGTWLNEHNVALFGEFALLVLDRAHANGLNIDWLIFDLEPELAYAEMLRSTATRGDLGALLQLLAEHRDVRAFEAATGALRSLTGALHTRGVSVMVTTLPWTIDDLVDGDPDLQDVFDTPLNDVAWDQVAVMAYRPVFADMFGLSLSPGYVASYARSAREAFGPTAQVAIGNIGTPGLLVPRGYTDPLDVYLDVSAARSAGIGSISMFSLDGMVTQGGAEPWLNAGTTPTPRCIQPDPATYLLRGALHWLDGLANTE